MSNKALVFDMAAVLKPLLHKFVFVGGCAVEFLIEDEAALGVRVTKDVDVIVEIAAKMEYYSLVEQLKGLGFKEVMPTGDEIIPICRLKYENMLLDVMPTNEAILGFASRWYLPALEDARPVMLDDLEINMIAPAYFIATKLEAFRGRGKSDYYCHDMEDIIIVLNGNNRIVPEIQNADADVRNYICKEFSSLMLDPKFKVNCIPGYLRWESKKRHELVYQRIIDLVR